MLVNVITNVLLLTRVHNLRDPRPLADMDEALIPIISLFRLTKSVNASWLLVICVVALVLVIHE